MKHTSCPTRKPRLYSRIKNISGELQIHFHSSVPCLAFTRDSYSEAREDEYPRRLVKNGVNNVSDAKNARCSRRERLREPRCTDAGKVDHPRSMIPGALRSVRRKLRIGRSRAICATGNQFPASPRYAGGSVRSRCQVRCRCDPPSSRILIRSLRLFSSRLSLRVDTNLEARLPSLGGRSRHGEI